MAAVKRAQKAAKSVKVDRFHPNIAASLELANAMRSAGFTVLGDAR
jgi:hypothetical protein